MANSGDRKKSRDAKKKKSGSYNKTPKMPKDTNRKKDGIKEAFQPGKGGAWSAKVGTRDVRRATKDGRQLISNRQGNDDTFSLESSTFKQKRVDSKQRAADTKNITKIGKY